MKKEDEIFCKHMELLQVKAKLAIAILDQKIDDLNKKLERSTTDFDKNLTKNEIKILKLKQANCVLAINHCQSQIEKYS